MIKEAIAHVAAGQSLTEQEAIAVMEEIMTGEATTSQLGAFLTACVSKAKR
jgi:anthranilate phosphoribosyltransferase